MLAADAPSLLPAILDDAPRMNFIRFCELLELAAPDAPPLGTTDSPAADPIRFRSRAQLGFPGREIDAVRYDTDQPAAPPSVVTTFLGLYGVDARMPAYFVDEVAQNRDGAERLSAFLDLFHHRVITQYYRVARKYRYPVGFRRDGTDPVSRYLLSFAGFGFSTSARISTHITTRIGTATEKQQASVARAQLSEIADKRRLLSMLGLAMQKTRTAEGLAGVLRHAVPDASIAVEEFHPVWREVDEVEPAALGEQCLLGRGFYDRANTVRVVITPGSRETVLALVPGQRAHREVMALLRFYLGYESEADLEMHVRPELMPTPTLEPRQANLGFTAQLEAPAGDAARITQITPITRITRVQLGRWNGAGEAIA
ncbi:MULTISPECIES: type VI secretion system baseplate subunit TssG [unclassified Caballeronia]|uniref:type VI secretion system baseplate subunit TssG n=1 Tax=unclassified Caballeronia TaxID=2646786 RepID=UPI002854E540|nr:MULTISPECIES: type VI secretion system baseplate subunit TssG [unclassified Caballeronia]MDR5752217.1 type VI secretion system baseplate subunit TssG [Caballeronia sp. LZ024]MDR5841928.1 type VI secretion system baseplate subunit TssG [Caballeronia sp. LZ031]